MRHIGFTRPVTVGTGRRAATVHHEVVPMPAANAEALAHEHRGAVVDLTPRDLGYPVFTPVRLTGFRLNTCPTCLGAQRMTVCRTCNGRGRVMEIA